jgi:hypothetical protein
VDARGVKYSQADYAHGSGMEVTTFTVSYCYT